MNQSVKIGSVIVTLNSPHLQECLDSLKKSNFRGIKHKIFTIDNSKNNRGFSAGNNLGIKKALRWGADAVMLLNDDTKLDQQAIKYLHTSLFSRSSIGLVVPKIYFYPGYEYHQQRYTKQQRGKVFWYAGGSIDWQNIMGKHRGVDQVDTGQFDRSQAVTFATGCCVMIKRQVLETVGLLDEKYFLYLEDLDYSVRVSRAGYQIIYQPQAKIWHKNAQSSEVGSSLQDYYFTRNRLLFGFKYAPLRTKFALYRQSLKLFFLGNKWQKKGVRDFYLRKFGRGSYESY